MQILNSIKITAEAIERQKFKEHQKSINNFQTHLQHTDCREKAVKTGKNARFCKVVLVFSATPKPWVVGSSPSAPAKKPKFYDFGFVFLLAVAAELSPTVLRRLDFIVIMRRFASLRSFNSLKSSGASRKTVINCFSLAYLLPLPNKKEWCA